MYTSASQTAAEEVVKMIRFRWSASLVLFALGLFLARDIAAQQPSATATNPAGAYPNTSEGLNQLIGDILQSAREKNSTKESELVRSLIFPQDSTWFISVYGPGFGASLASAYRREAPEIEEQVKSIYEENVVRGWMTPKILRYADPESVHSPIDHFLNCMDQIVPLYQTAFRGDSPSFYASIKTGPGARFGAGDLNGYFIYDRDGFRFVPSEILMKLPNERPVRIKLDYNVMRSKIMSKLIVNIPTEAFSKHMSGRVVVHLVLDTGGKIKELKVLEGNPILSAPVVEAIKQCQFAPTKLDGDPVEVELDIPYAFEFH
jgi:TonB family protein